MSQVSLLEGLKQDLAELVAIPSISAPGYPEPTQPHCSTAFELSPSCSAPRACRTSGRSTCRTPRRCVTGEIPAPTARRPSCSTATTTSCPRGTRRCGRRRRSCRPSATARCTAAARRTPRRTSSPTSARCARGTGRPPVGHQARHRGPGGGRRRRADDLPADRTRRRSRCDAMVIGDMGSVRPGRADAHGRRCAAWRWSRSRSRRWPAPSTAASSAAPRPTRCSRVLRALASLHDDNGDVAVDGLRREEWDGRVLQRRRVPRARPRSATGCR